MEEKASLKNNISEVEQIKNDGAHKKVIYEEGKYATEPYLEEKHPQKSRKKE